VHGLASFFTTLSVTKWAFVRAPNQPRALRQCVWPRVKLTATVQRKLGAAPTCVDMSAASLTTPNTVS